MADDVRRRLIDRRLLNDMKEDLARQVADDWRYCTLRAEMYKRMTAAAGGESEVIGRLFIDLSVRFGELADVIAKPPEISGKGGEE